MTAFTFGRGGQCQTFDSAPRHQECAWIGAKLKRTSFAAVFITTIVIVTFGILIAIGVTGRNAAVRAANEAVAIKMLQTIAEQQKLYYNGNKRGSFGTFDEMLAGQLLDTRFAGTSPVVDGFVYNMRVIPKATTRKAGFAVNADPLVTEGFGATGKRHFYVDSDSGTIHVNSRQPATASDPRID